MRISPRSSRSIKDGLRLRVHHGSGNVAAHLALADGKEVAVGARALAQLRLEAPAFVSGRVLREADSSPVGGARVTLLQRPDAYGRGRLAFEVMSDDEGAFQVDGLSPGLYEVHLRPIADQVCTACGEDMDWPEPDEVVRPHRRT